MCVTYSVVTEVELYQPAHTLICLECVETSGVYRSRCNYVMVATSANVSGLVMHKLCDIPNRTHACALELASFVLAVPSQTYIAPCPQRAPEPTVVRKRPRDTHHAKAMLAFLWLDSLGKSEGLGRTPDNMHQVVTM